MRYRARSILLIMVLCAYGILGAQESIPDVKIRITERSRTIGQSLEEISLQTGLNFTYDASLVRDDQKVLFGANEEALKSVLDRLLDRPDLAYTLIGRNIVIYREGEQLPPLDTVAPTRPLLRGRILDERSGKGLPFATITLHGTSLGSVSNLDGEFSFKFPWGVSDPLLVISFMGYTNRVIHLSYPFEEYYEIGLERDVIPLQEVIIRYTDPEKLLEEAIRRIPENYLDQSSAMTAYYREAVKRNDRCMLYFESLMDVDKSAYNRPALNDHVGIRKARKLSDTSSGDTVIMKLRSGVFTALSLDVVKSRPDFLSENFLELYQLDFTDMMSYKDRLVYVIRFRQKEHINDILLRGKLYLDKENLSILAADFEYDPDQIRHNPELFLVSSSRRIRVWPLLAKYHVDYRMVNEQYHLSQVRGEVEFKVRKKRKWIGARYHISFDMAVTSVRPGEYLKIERPDRLRPGRVMTDQTFDFDPAFWGPFNSIEPEASLIESLQKIEHLLQEINEEP